jgi:NAD+--dinitrogen-reductase ADP-D-ribosyltransferase
MFQKERAQGLYNTNALETQLNLVYSFCQHELARRLPGRTHLRLYRGVNRLDEHEILARPQPGSFVLLLNNLSSFTATRERADEFGDRVLVCDLPLVKLLYFPGLLPGLLQGEDEHRAIGGLYEVELDHP